MEKTPLQTYRAYQPRPFTQDQRQTTTILFGGAHWRLERLLEGLFENLGYRARALPNASRDDLVRGRELADVGQCCPTTFTTGNLANFLMREVESLGSERVNRDYVYLTAGACGACRFGQYHQSYEMALRNIGLDAFRMFLLGQTKLDQGSVLGGGLKLDMPLTIGAVAAAMISDIVRDMEFQLRPYEIVPGSSERASKAAIEELHAAFVARPRRGRKWGALAWHVITSYFSDALKSALAHFDDVEVDRLRVKPKVMVTGEFYLQTVEGPANYDIHRWLEKEGAEVCPNPVTVWLDYNVRFYRQHYEDRKGLERGAAIKIILLRVLSRMLHRSYDKLRRSASMMPGPMPDQDEISSLASPFFNSRLSGGEGDMLIGKAIQVHLNRKAHMVCELSPYACLPNTMSIGAMAGVLGRYSDLLYAPVEIKGDAEIHALSRCQMTLTEARKRATQEFDAALVVTGLTIEEARSRLSSRPDMRRAIYQVPHRGAAGTAANVVLELGGARL